VTVEDAWMTSPANPEVAGVFLTLHNRGDVADRLLGGSTDVAGIVEVHETVSDDAGRTRMQPMTEGLELPPGEDMVLRPGGYHVMLRDITAPPEPGDTVTVTLRFQRAAALTIEVPVREPMMGEGPMGAGHAMGHGAGA
jgi:copper(I)-binding protein